MNENLRTIHDAIALAGQNAAFSKRKGVWVSDLPEAALVIEPQKSDWGEEYFINLGVYFRSLGNRVVPRVHQSHVQGRLESLIDDDEGRSMAAALNFEVGLLNPAERRGTIARLLRERAIPFLVSIGSGEGFRAAYESGRLNRFGVVKELKDPGS